MEKGSFYKVNFLNEKAHSGETKERGISNSKEIVFVRHGQRGVGEGQTSLTAFGREQARETGKHLRQQGIDLSDYDSVDVFASYSGDVDPQSHLPRAAETIQLVGEALGLPRSTKTPKRLTHVELEQPINPSHYNHNELLRSHLPENYSLLSNGEKVKAEQIALSKTLDAAMADQSPEAVAYREEVAGAAAFVLLVELGLIKSESSHSKSLLLIGIHSTFLEWLFKEAFVWKDQEGLEHIGYRSLEEIGGPLHYAEAVRMRLGTDNAGQVKAIEVVFTNPRRPVKSGYLNQEKLIGLATAYAKLHFSE